MRAKTSKVVKAPKQPRAKRVTTPRSGRAQPEPPTYEPPSSTDLDAVLVDFEQARQPRGELAIGIAAEAQPDVVEFIVKQRRTHPSLVFDLNPYCLHLKKDWNRRNFDTEQRRKAIDTYARSIAKVGVREVLSAHIEDERIYVDHGWNRLLATFRAIEIYGAPVKGIPVRFGRPGEDEASRKLSQIVNNMGEAPLPYEQGMVCKDLINLGWTIEQIAASIGRTETNVKAILELHELPMEIQQLVNSGTVSAYMATRIFREHDGNAERSLKALRRAVEYAHSIGAKRVLPRYAELAEEADPNGEPVKRPRRNGSNSKHVLALVEATKRGHVIERNDDDGFVIVRYDAETYDLIATIAQIPDEAKAPVED